MSTVHRRQKCKCTSCPLASKDHVYGRGGFQSKIAFYGEAPGREEDAAKGPFVGRAGKLFSWALGEIGLFRDKVFISNCILCRPPDNDIQSLEAKKALVKCRPGFDEEIAFLRKKGITTVVTLGGTATHYFGIEGKISKIRGSVYQVHGVNVIPTFHPSYLNRMGFVKSSGRVDMKLTWINDLRKAKEIADGYVPPEEKFITAPKLADIEKFVSEVKGKPNPLLALDIETTSLRRDYAKVVCIGFARDKAHAVCIPWLPGSWGNPWPNGIRHKVRRLVNELLALPLVLQNAVYDIPILQRNGFRVDFNNVKHDTLLLSHVISPELPHNLGFIVSVYGDTPYWKEDFLDRSVSILDMDLEELSTYNCRDCVVLHQVLPGLLGELSNLGPGAESVYYRQSLPMLPIVSAMKDVGVKVSPHRLARYKAELEGDLDKTKEELLTTFNLPQLFNPSSTDEMKYFLYGEELHSFPSDEDMEDFTPHTEWEVKCPVCKKKTWVADETLAYCPKCSAEGLIYLGTTREKSKRKPGSKVHGKLRYLHCLKSLGPLRLPPRWAPPKTDNGASSIDGEARLSLRIATQNRIAALDGMKRPTTSHREERQSLTATFNFLALYDAYQHTMKLLSTYTSYPTWSDGKVHSDFLITGTATGRLSSKGPNLQQLPKKEKKARTVFVPEKGNVFISGDYTNLEVYVLAFVSGDEELQNILLSGRNIHDENTLLFGVGPEDPLWDLARRAAKIFQFALIQYGGSERGIYEKVLLECPELPLTFARFREIKRGYMRKYPQLAVWQEETKRHVRENRCGTTAFGRKRTFFGPLKDIERQGLNFPIQATAADIINLAMIRVFARLEETSANLILQIHDQLVVETPKEEVSNIHKILTEEMSREVTINGRNVSFPVDFETGPSLGELKEYKS